MKHSHWWFTPAIAVTIGIFMLSTFLTGPAQSEGVSNFDKVEHAFAYLVLTLSFLVAFHKTGNFNKKVAFMVFLASGSYGMLMELLQHYFFEYRHFEWYDAIANVTGTATGFLMFGIWQKVSSRM
ncbi:MAG: VanZ family protein [Ekhidna sp.]|nr:VanZ family protein [Ekhidna sp.]